MEVEGNKAPLPKNYQGRVGIDVLRLHQVAHQRQIALEGGLHKAVARRFLHVDVVPGRQLWPAVAEERRRKCEV